MGSIGEDEAVIGQYRLPFLDENSENDDPWKRNYGQPPTSVTANLVTRNYPLDDIRPLLANNSTTDLLKSHGFGVVKHRSPFVEYLQSVDGALAEQAMSERYYPEVEQLVKDTVGAKSVIVMGGMLRQGTRAPEEWKIPTALRPIQEVVADQQKEKSKDSPADDLETVKQKLLKQQNLSLGAPIRIPHMDFTDQGARSSIRHQDKEVFDAARRAIAYEDKICADQSFNAEAHEANSLIDENYNQNGQLGPRYAAYSIWRPLRKVERDPITLGPPGVAGGSVRGQIDHERIYWPYLNRYKGFEGEFLKEFAMLGVNKREQGSGATNDMNGHHEQKWYYLAGQEPDEVLFIKQFDSAARGSDAQHAPAPWHGSPEIGNGQGNEPRESIELRVFAFW